MSNTEIFETSKEYMPGGVNSPVRAFNNVGMNPPIIKEGKGVTYMMKKEKNMWILF